MYRLFAGLLPLLAFSLAHAAEEAEQPMTTTNTIGIIVFVIALVACIAVYVWMTMRNEKKSESDKLGEKF